MKRILFIVGIVVFSALTINGFSQSKVKIGHIDSQELLPLMPEMADAKAAIEKHAKELEDQLKAMQQELEAAYNDYIKNESTYSNLVKKTKQDEINSMQQRIQDFQNAANTDLQNKESELLQPIIDKAKKAIDDVAKEKGYTYVFDTSVGVLLYWPEDSDDLLPFVKEKLGITQ
ncbi:MAG: OmpH family outer membrane protein [Marinilabiliales bacterium]